MKPSICFDLQTLIHLKKWFDDYVKTFRSRCLEDQRNIDLKETHSRHVCREIAGIGESVGLKNDTRRLAEIIGLFHDIGRFEQYRRYGTFSDLKSEDHAALGIKVLMNLKVLDGIDFSVSELIRKAIFYHNKAMVPDSESDMCLFYSKLLRDADKLDILRVVTDYYLNEEENKTIDLDLPDLPFISDAVFIDVMKGKTVKTGDLQTRNDFKVLQMSWVYDIHFLRTFRLIKKRNYMNIIHNFLPSSEKARQIYGKVCDYLEDRCKNHEDPSFMLI